jgi:hypothetical protein
MPYQRYSFITLSEPFVITGILHNFLIITLKIVAVLCTRMQMRMQDTYKAMFNGSQLRLEWKLQVLI